ncbi:MAG TPA: ChbG/HpnK family deacetylase [Burkholderiaceae bacterium]|jgi:predicted glycoside hydrolase/deacetylase ChbG (UPF0249 family)
MKPLPAGRRIAICADDFGYSAGIDSAILSLLAEGRLSAVSCMSTAPYWRADAARLHELAQGRADLGLHLNLSESFFVTEPRSLPLRELILRAYTGRLSAAELRIRIALQLDAFESALGRAPDFVDGHQHVHQLPIVRRVLLAELERRYPGRLPWLRDTTPGPAAQTGFKSRLIASLGARPLRRQALRRGFAQNRGFAGVYDFDGDEADYFHRLLGWLAGMGERSLLMCHPSLDEAPGDPIAAARQREYAVLRGDAFGQALAALGLSVGRLQLTPS